VREGRVNRLAKETSPYLLQHAHNPVDWYPWGPEAHERARRDNKPILLSIGYSACHWCHVMERESFEDESIAALMNESFVNIKVDREERPDVDEIYMNAVQMMTGSGGWPLTVFLTPELKPFYGGTYFPPDDRWGRPGFRTVLKEIARIYTEEGSRVQEASEALTERLGMLATTPQTAEILTRHGIGDAARELAARFDPREGGFSQAPKFPPAGALSLLLRHYRESGEGRSLDMVELTLDKMASGGLYDHLGGGFHRYSTDERWLVPHFEKMLYDNALLARCYLEAFQLTANPAYGRVVRETLDWTLREMQGESGGYYSTQDADSEGMEGKFYVWSPDEVRDLLGENAAALCELYDITSDGNWEGKNILHLEGGLASYREDLSPALGVLLKAREARVRPGLDDKVLTSWNALMIIAMARGYRVLGDHRFLDSARGAVRFIEESLYDGERLLATFRHGRSKLKAYLDDYAFLLGAYVELFESDFDPHWLDRANRLADALGTLFRDESLGGFFFTGSDHEKLIVRSKTGYDGAIPSGNGMAATYLLRLAEYTGSHEYESLGVSTLHAFHAQLARSPSSFAQLLAALDFYLSEKREIVVVGRRDSDRTVEALSRLWRMYAPNASIALLDPDGGLDTAIPLFEGKSAGAESDIPRFYVCESYACKEPTDSLDEVVGVLHP
jgi:uncharacterized protein YyaL (SSP411 family)